MSGSPKGSLGRLCATESNASKRGRSYGKSGDAGNPYWGIDTDAFVINGNTMLYKDIDGPALIPDDELQESRGKGKIFGPSLYSASGFRILLSEREIVQRVNIDTLLPMSEVDLDVKDSVIYVIKASFEANIRGDIDLASFIQGHWFGCACGFPRRRWQQLCGSHWRCSVGKTLRGFFEPNAMVVQGPPS